MTRYLTLSFKAKLDFTFMEYISEIYIAEIIVPLERICKRKNICIQSLDILSDITLSLTNRKQQVKPIKSSTIKLELSV